MPALFSAVVLQLSFRDVITGIPHDAGSIVVYIILAAFLYGIWRGSKSRGGKGDDRVAGQAQGSRKGRA